MVSYQEFLDLAWPLIKLKSSSKVLGQDMGPGVGVQSVLLDRLKGV